MSQDERAERSAADCDLLILAELNPDVVVAAGAGPLRFGQVEQLVPHAAITLGSSGAITAAAAAAQSVRTALCAVVGADPAGAVALDMLDRLGVDRRAVLVRADVATGVTVVLSRPGGDRALLTFPGAMPALRAADVPMDVLRAARHVHVSSFFLQQGLHTGLAELLGAARAAGATTSLDPGWDPAERWEGLPAVLPELDYLLPNEAECRHVARTVTGRTLPDTVAAAAALAALGPSVVVKCGADGAVAVSGREALRCAAGAATVVDTTGAGDNFDAGFLAAVLLGAPLDAALRRAVASGSVAVGGHGGTGRMATAEEAERDGAALRIRQLPVRTFA